MPESLILVALAAWYITHVIVATKGPWSIFTALRARLPLGGLTTCEYCLIIWAAIAWWLILLTPAHDVIYPFAAAGGAMLLYRQTGGGQGD